MAAAGLLAGGWILWSCRRRTPVLPAVALVALLAALVTLAQLAGPVIVFRGDAALACLYLLGFALAVVVGQFAAEEWGHKRAFESLAWLLLVGALVSVWLALYQWQRLDYLGVFATDLDFGGRPFANFNQPNHLATLLVLGLVAAALLYDAGRFGGSTALVLIVLLGFGVAMTQSRGGLLAVAVGAVGLLGKGRSLGRRLARRDVLIGVLLVLTMPLAWEGANSLLGQVVGRTTADAASAGTRRLIHWSSMFDAVLRQPWVGYGWNQSVLAQFAVAPDHPPSFEVFSYSHNILIDLVIWNGLPLGLFFIAGLGLWLRVAWRGADDSTTVLALAGVIAVLVQALVEYPLYYTYFLLPIGLLIGVISATTMPQAVLRVPAWLAPALLAVTGVLLAVITSDYLGLEADLRSLRFERARIGTDRPRHELSHPLLLTHVAAFAKFARTPEREGMSAADLGAMNAVAHRFPSAENIVRYAAALALNQHNVEATEVLRRICKMHHAAACETQKALWQALGQRQPAIAAVRWPVD